MPKRRVLHVVPNSDETDNKWKVTDEEDEGFEVTARTKQQALLFAQEIIASQIVIHGKDGKIQKEYTYGLDPKKSKG